MVVLKATGVLYDGYIRLINFTSELPKEPFQILVDVQFDVIPEQIEGETLSDEELSEHLRPEPKLARDIEPMEGWEELIIEDSLEWVNELRRQRKRRRKWIGFL